MRVHSGKTSPVWGDLHQSASTQQNRGQSIPLPTLLKGRGYAPWQSSPSAEAGWYDESVEARVEWRGKYRTELSSHLPALMMGAYTHPIVLHQVGVAYLQHTDILLSPDVHQ